MSAQEIANKLWNLCNVLRDDGVTYHEYLNELTYILFLKLSEVKGFDKHIPEEYQWQYFVKEHDNNEAFARYREFLATVSNKTDSVSIQEIYSNASTSLRKPVNFRSLVTAIDKLDWYEEDDRDVMGDIYESLLQKNAGEKKSGAGQYFTPRPLINIMVDLLAPKLGERWTDPAAGTFGFMISADHYLRSKHDNYYDLPEKDRKFQVEEAFSGVELVPDAHRLALMNARLHGMESTIHLGDTLTEGESLQFTGLPFFAPEIFRMVEAADPMRNKQLRTGLLQLGEEGAIQVFRPITGGTMLLGAFGQLQFEVVAHRLQTEYGAEVRLLPARYNMARWVSSNDPIALKKFTTENSHRMAEDVVGASVFLAAHKSELDVAQQRWEMIEFHALREHAGLIYQTEM